MFSQILKEYIPVDVGRMREPKFIEMQMKYNEREIERVNQMHGWKNVEACPLCGATEYTKEFEKFSSPLVRCHGCDLRYHVRVPVDLGDIYMDDDYVIYVSTDEEDQWQYRKNRFGTERVRLLARYCGDLKGKKLLDIGCGNGFFLMAAKEAGAVCVGGEFSKKFSEFTRKRVGVPVYQEPLTRFPERDFDIITSFDVIEHIPDPLSFVKSAADLLKPGGHMLLYTPNFDSFSIKVIGPYSSIVAPQQHVILFTQKALAYLGRKAGLEVVHTETKGLDFLSILAYQDFLGQKRDAFVETWVHELQAMIDASGAADYMRVIYRKA